MTLGRVSAQRIVRFLLPPPRLWKWHVQRDSTTTNTSSLSKRTKLQYSENDDRPYSQKRRTIAIVPCVHGKVNMELTLNSRWSLCWQQRLTVEFQLSEDVCHIPNKCSKKHLCYLYSRAKSQRTIQKLFCRFLRRSSGEDKTSISTIPLTNKAVFHTSLQVVVFSIL